MLSQSSASLLNTFESFKKDLLTYCSTQKLRLALTDAEIKFLYGHTGNQYRSPEAGKNDSISSSHFHPEIIRSLIRRYSYELLLRGEEADYLEFVQAQNDKNKLSLDEFNKLSAELNKLSDDCKVVIAASTIFVMNNHLRNRVKDKCQLNLPADGEAALSSLAELTILNPELTPLTKTMTPAQRTLLQKAFWPKLHMRWLYSTEGGDNMTQTLIEGIRAGKFNQEQDLSVWTWRWRLNVAGFQGGPGAKIYDKISHELIENVLLHLKALFIDTNYQFLHQYLIDCSKEAGIRAGNVFTLNEVKFLGHLIAYLVYFHRVDITTSKNSSTLMHAYLSFRHHPGNTKVADDYVAACANPNANTPTYVPGVMDTALGLFMYQSLHRSSPLPDTIDILELFNHDLSDDVIWRTVYFMCQLSEKLYDNHLSQPVSCMELAKIGNLRLVLEQWLEHDKEMEFKVTDKGEVTVTPKSSLKLML